MNLEERAGWTHRDVDLEDAGVLRSNLSTNALHITHLFGNVRFERLSSLTPPTKELSNPFGSAWYLLRPLL